VSDSVLAKLVVTLIVLIGFAVCRLFGTIVRRVFLDAVDVICSQKKAGFSAGPFL